MHATQKFILVQLIERDSAKFSDLKPAAMEGSKFTYHLKQLQDNDLVHYNANTKQYQLSSAGRVLADRFDTKLLNETAQPAIVVLTAVERHPNEWLLAERHIQPAYGKKGFPHVKVKLGSQLITQAAQTLEEVTGIESRLQYSGHAYVTQYQNNELESTVLAHVLRGTCSGGKLVNTTDDYTFQWVRDPVWQDDSIIPSCGPLVKLSNQDTLFFDELVYHL